MQFSEVIGQQKIKERLIRSVTDGRISHAQLFLGSEGSGNLSLSLAFAQYITCLDRNDHDSCGVCPSCLKYKKLIHPDLHFVFPVVKTKNNDNPVSDHYIKEWREILLENPYLNLKQWLEKLDSENLQGSIYKNESSEILRKLNLKTYESEFKVMIIWMPEKMQPTTSNKLLKILEEPPPKTLFILVSENTSQILPTILSRTQLVKIPKIDFDSLYNKIKDLYNLSVQELNDIVRLADGNYLKANEIIRESEESEFNFKMFIDLMRSCYGREILKIIAWVEIIAEQGREKQKNFLEYSLRLIRENFILNTGQEKITLLSEKEASFSQKFSLFINSKNVIQISEELNKAYFHIERNGYDKIILLDMALKMVKLLKK
ncbi:MAG: DNA polymerase III subunit delta [Bacteroidia bacterium]|nr:DNA polymerase III subunit delta [Bacteroidia bacterium]